MIGWLRRLLGALGGRAEPPAPAAPRPSASQRAVEAGIKIEYQGAPGPQPAQPAELKWKRERLTGPSTALDARRASARQRVLVALATVSLLAMAVALVVPLLVNRRLPPAVFGVYGTDAAPYADRLFELRARRVAFVTRDSTRPVMVFVIKRVESAVLEDGRRYTVQYADSGRTLEFRFLFEDASPPVVRFTNQPKIAWRRLSTTRTLMPEIY